MLISRYNHCYVQHCFVYINKNDFSNTEKRRFFGDLKKRFFRKPIKLHFRGDQKKRVLETVNNVFSWRYSIAFFGIGHN